MRPTARWILLSGLLASLGAAALAAGLPPQYAGTPTAKDYPTADVLILSEAHDYTLAPDGRVTEHVRQVEKMLTYQGMDEAGDPKITFDKENQDLTIARCRTYTPDGAVVDAKANSFNEMTPFALEKAPAYTAWRQMVVTKVGLDINAVVELDYTLADKTPWRRFLDVAEVVQGGDPALSRSVSVTVPEGMDLHYALTGLDARPAVSTAAGATTYAWTFTNVPLALLAGTTAAERSFLPTLSFTTAPDWAHQASIVGGLVEAAVAASSPALDAKTDALLKDAKDSFDKVQKLQEYVADDINTIHWPPSLFDFAPRPASQVYDTGYGHALDKAVLLCAMLRRAGFKTTVDAAGLGLNGEASRVPGLAAMDRVLVQVTMGDDRLLVDPDAKLAEESHKDFTGYEMLPFEQGATSPQPVAALDFPDRLSADLTATLSKDLGFEGSGNVTLEGHYCPYYAVRGDEKALKAFAQRLVAAVLPGAEVTGQSVLRMEPDLCAFTVNFKAGAPPKAAPAALELGLPGCSRLAEYHGAHLERRDLPLVLASGGSEKVTVRLSLPEELKAVYVPRDASLRNACGSFSRTFKAGDGAVAMTFEAEVPGRIVSPKDYPAFRELYGRAGMKSGRTLLFR